MLSAKGEGAINYYNTATKKILNDDKYILKIYFMPTDKDMTGHWQMGYSSACFVNCLGSYFSFPFLYVHFTNCNYNAYWTHLVWISTIHPHRKQSTLQRKKNIDLALNCCLKHMCELCSAPRSVRIILVCTSLLYGYAIFIIFYF